MKPQHIQLKRTKGFNLQRASHKLNGLPAVNCARPGKWGNPVKIGHLWLMDDGHIALTVFVSNAFSAVNLYRKHIIMLANMNGEEFFEPLRGKNLACYCKSDMPCHCDVLLEFANQ